MKFVVFDKTVDIDDELVSIYEDLNGGKTTMNEYDAGYLAETSDCTPSSSQSEIKKGIEDAIKDMAQTIPEIAVKLFSIPK